ncbi:Multicopper oxidase [Handroanthus impetiginosus]|uniref:Laccase n=1 Tax=Handroanthus impetiginosus TaxID=429701 RepID=A0A2G9I6B1_9LAMI|nr:Multicopper oxidase [Handroanthus impetiginosus]
MKILLLHFTFFLFLCYISTGDAMVHRYKFVLKDTQYTRLCSNKSILTVNGQFPGPTLYVNEGDTIVVDVINRASENVTIHWHGVKQPRYPWSDGPAYITQCPIQPGTRFSQKIVLSDEVGTLWWHAHSDWSRKPDAEVPIILGEWWKSDIMAVLNGFVADGGDPNISDAFLINGQPGDLYPCSRPDTFKLTVDYGKTYLIRMVNAVMNNIMFFRIANHKFTIVGSDGSYTKPFTRDYISIPPGQTIDFLLEANQQPSHYYMAARVYAIAGTSDNTTTTAIVEYSGNYSAPSSPLLPTLPALNDTASSTNFVEQLRSLGSKDHPVDVPLNVDNKFFFTLSINTFQCPPDAPCQGAQGGRFRASVNNITFVPPRIAILQAYYNRIRGVYGDDFPSKPPFRFNYTQEKMIPRDYWTPQNGTEVRVLEYNSVVEIVFQGTNLVAGIYHPMHLHGYSFYVVGSGSGNFDKDRDPLNYNLVDPPFQNTIVVPVSGWTAIRFKANNPGVWLMHCHLERHTTWGMEMAFIVKNGKGSDAKMLPPPPDMPRC